MSYAYPENDRAVAPRGEVHFVDDAARAELEAAIVSESLLLVPLPSPGPALRGRLALHIESAIEDALDRRGASPPGVGASSDLDASLSDQLYRARQVGAGGLGLSLYTLEGIANLASALDAEDSAVLRWWLAAARERPVRLLIDVRDRDLAVYGPPLALARLIEPDSTAPLPIADPVPSADPELVASSAAMELSVPPPTVVVAEDPRARCAPVSEVVAEEPVEAQDVRAEHVEAQGVRAEHMDAESVVAESVVAESVVAESVVAESVEPQGEAQAEPELDLQQELDADADANDDEDEDEDGDEPEPVIAPAVVRPVTTAEWQGWVRELETARGPKPLAVVERMFVSAYMPLVEAVLRGFAGEEAETALSTWAEAFDKSYSEAFDALRVRGKRPTMVLDVPDIALRIARLHGARSVQLLLVDGMRFDLGVRVHDRMRARLGQRAALTERLLLWSALPTTTAVQLELLGRGPSALREPIEPPESDIVVARGKSAATPRRVRAGHREILKLDIVESAMSVPGGPLAERLDDLAEETAEILAGHLSRQAPRTLVMVFGDHGFVVEPQGSGTSAGLQGGASPEEVLVPAFAWLVGAVH